MKAMRYAKLMGIAAAALLAASGAGAQAAGQPPTQAAEAASDDELFGAEEVTESKPAEAAPEKAFLKYDAVKLGGSLSGSLGGSLLWDDPWSGAEGASKVDDYYLSPSLSGKVTITAKPAEDFGVNADFRMSYPFSSTITTGSGATAKSYAIPNLSVWALYSKFSLADAVFMSFGKQPIAWGVSKGFFQPADDIFAMSAVDFGDLSAEREGPLVFKAMIPVPRTMTSFYFYAGLPPSDYTKPEELRLAAKAEFNAGNTEFAAAGYWCYNDFPRGLLMATTGIGSFNFFGELVGTYGGYKLAASATPLPIGTKISDELFLTGTLGGYYTDSNAHLTILGQILYNGEPNTTVSLREYYAYYAANASAMRGSKYNTWYAGASVSKTKLFTDDLSAGAYAVANLEDFSGLVSPYLSYSFSDYSSVKLSGYLTFGAKDEEYILLSGKAAPEAILSLTFTLGSGSF